MIRESLKISLDSLKHRKVSSSLTVLGIIIGISAIIGLVSIGEGLKQSVSEQLESFGPDKIIVMPAMAGGLPGTAFLGEGLTEDDVETIEHVNGVKMAAGVLFKTLPLEYKKETVTTYVMGMHAEDADKLFLEMKIFDIAEGRTVKKGESGSMVIGSMVVDKLFENEVKIGDTISIKDKKFKVVGILKSIGNNQDDKSVFISLKDIREIVGGKNTLSMIFVKASDPAKVENTAERIEKKLDDKYGENAFSTITSEQITETVGSIFSILSFVLGGIASIALIVAGVGIANTMFTSVLERTREIGVMKAIGATNYNVMEIFLVESALLGFIGGVIGCVFGFIFSKIINIFAAGMLPVEFRTVVTLEMILLGLGFSVFVGIISGLYPARKAAKMQPVEALRYE